MAHPCCTMAALGWSGLGKVWSSGELVPVQANRMSSVHTQLPFSIYTLPFCVPHQLKYEPETLGEVLQGSVIQNTPYELAFQTSRLRALCKLRIDHEGARAWARLIREDYRAHLLLEGLPVATRSTRRAGRSHLEMGYRLGSVTGTGAALNNHLDFVVRYHRIAPPQDAPSVESARIVGFEVQPSSRAWAHSKPWPADFEGSDFQAKDPLNLAPATVGLQQKAGPCMLDESGGRSNEVIFTYTVSWVPSDVPYASRWDVYLHMDEGSARVHWFAVTGSLAISLMLALLVAAIMLRTVRRDLQQYSVEEVDDLLHEVRWKYCHTDCMRPPPEPLLLATLVGSGIQLMCVVFVAVLLALLGLVSPTHRGSLLTAALVLFAAAGGPGGYAAARLYRQLRGRRMYALIVAVATLVPGVVFVVFLGLDMVRWVRGSSAAVPIGTLLSLLLLWLGIDGSALVLQIAALCIGRRIASFRRRLNRAQFPRLEHVESANLFSVWFPLPDDHHDGRHLRRGWHCDVLLHAL